MKLKISTVVWTFIWCLFMGVTVGSIGIGAIFPQANLIAGPFVCPGGKMQVVTQDYHPSPIETVTTLTWYCVDGKTGTQTELGIFPMSLYAGTIYGLALFVVVFIGMAILANKRPLRRDPDFETSEAMDAANKLRESAPVNREEYEELAKKLRAKLDERKQRD